MDLSYRPVGGASKATLTREIASSKAGPRTTTPRLVAGALGVRVGAGIEWLQRAGPLTGRRYAADLHDELSLSVDYRDPVATRHTLIAQVIGRRYKQNGHAAMGETISNVGVIGVDWAYHPNELLSVHAKAARKLEHIDGLSPSTTSWRR